MDVQALRDAFQRKRYGPGEYDPDFDLFDAAADEIERLRAVLRLIADEPDEDNKWHGRDKFRDLRTVARSALEQNVQESENRRQAHVAAVLERPEVKAFIASNDPRQSPRKHRSDGEQSERD